MAKATSMPPKESVREWLLIKDGWLWWNPEKQTSPRADLTKPIRYGSKGEQNTVRIEGRTYNLNRLNYWMHTGEWPECVICMDNVKTNSHISNLKAGTASQANAHRHYENRTYTIAERIKRDGTRYYYAYFTLNGKKKTSKKYDTEQDAVNAAIIIRKLLYGEFTPNALKLIKV